MQILQASYQQWVLTVKKYCLVAVHMDSGYIHVEALRSLNAADITAYEAMLDFFRQRLGTVETLRLDHQCPQQLQASLQRACITYQKAPVVTIAPAAGARCARGNHFIASWATADVACPPPLWATTGTASLR
jgi:hypothetical protein